MEHPGRIGWAGLATGVYLWDRYAPQTLTGAMHEMLESKVGKVLVYTAIGATALHLANKLPHNIDPYYLHERRYRAQPIGLPQQP